MGTATTQRRRQRGEGAVYKRESDGRWVGTIDFGYINGKRKRKVVYGKTMAEVLRKRKAALKLAEAGDTSTKSMTVAAWLNHWLTTKKAKLKPLTYKSYANHIETYLIPVLGRVRLDQLEPDHVHELHDYMTKLGKANNTILNAHKTLSSALTAAMKQSKTHRNVVSLVEGPNPEIRKAPRRPLEMEEVERFLRAVAEDRLAARWMVAFMTGMRQGEVLGMEWDRLDLDAGVYDLAWQLQRLPYAHGCGVKAKDGWPCGRRSAGWCPERFMDPPRDFVYRPLESNFVLQETKSSTKRLVKLPEPVVLALRLRHEAYLEEREAYGTDHRLIFAGPDGVPYDRWQDGTRWHQILQAAGIPDNTTQHAARHTTATLLLKNGESPLVIQEILGHSEMVTTQGYAHADLTVTGAALARLGSVLVPPKS